MVGGHNGTGSFPRLTGPAHAFINSLSEYSLGPTLHQACSRCWREMLKKNLSKRALLLGLLIMTKLPVDISYVSWEGEGGDPIPI